MRPQHPSGRPKQETKIKGSSIWRIPLDGYLTPRLREVNTDAIGFVHEFDRKDEE
jgi:hypothetical protein